MDSSSRLPLITLMIAGACLSVTQELRQRAGWQWFMTGSVAALPLSRLWRMQRAVAATKKQSLRTPG